MTIRSLLGEDVSAILPERVYLRGHVELVAREVGLDPRDVLAQFDRENPVGPGARRGSVGPGGLAGAGSEQPHPTTARAVALSSVLGGIALLAIVLGFAKAFGF